jgi:hypothetical protein
MAKLKQTSGPKLTSSRMFSGSERYLELDYTGGWRYVNLRIPVAILDDLDQHLSGQQLKGQRMHWIIQAIIEKLEREQRH